MAAVCYFGMAATAWMTYRINENQSRRKLEYQNAQNGSKSKKQSHNRPGQALRVPGR
jgi:hypothetical protein